MAHPSCSMTPPVNVHQTLGLMTEGLKEVTAEKDNLIQENQKMADDLQKLKRKLQQKEASCSVARDQLAHKNDEIQKLKTQFSKLREEKERLMKGKDDEIQKLKTQFSKFLSSMKKEKERLMEGKDDEIQKLKTQFSKLREEKERLMEGKDDEIQKLKTQFSKLREEKERLMKGKDDEIQKLIEEISNQKGLLEDEKLNKEKVCHDLSVNVANFLQNYQKGLNHTSSTTTTAIITPPPQLQPPQAQPPSDPRQQWPRFSSAGPHNTGAIQARNNDAPLPGPMVSVATTTAKRNLAQELSRTDQKKRPADKEEGEIGTYRRDKKRQTCAANDTRPGKDRRH
jgi:DNA repair exonuclease SbcCD ATPase subunit